MRKSLVLYTIGIVILGCVIVLLASNSAITSTALDAALEQQVEDARTITHLFDGKEDSTTRSALERFSETHDMRIQLIKADGTVTFDSRTLSGAARVDPGANPELADALNGKTGSRRAPYDNVDSMYVAVKYSDDTTLRTIKPLDSMHQIVATRMRSIYLWSTLAPLLALIVTALYGYFSANTYKAVMNGMAQLQQGSYEYRIADKKASRSKMAGAFNAMAEQMERRWENAKRRNRAMSMITNTMVAGVVALDNNLNVLMLNPAARDMLGTTGSCEGMSISEATHDVKLNSVFAEAMEKEGVNMFDVSMLVPKSHNERPLRMYCSALNEDGRVVGVLALIEDITELKRLEQLRTDFAANVSHELKTPLTSIRGFVETLQAGAINDPVMAQKFLGIIDSETERLARLINDILSISKLESGDDQAERQQLALNELVNRRIQLLAKQANEKRITLTHNENAPQILIWANRDRIEQLLTNVIDNAIKYTPDGGTVTVTLYKDDTTAYFSCADTGIGIAEENLPRLFERFYRVDKGRSRSMGGTGLGLAIVKHIVNSLNGHIEVHSKLGEGTEFLISLPLYNGQVPNKDQLSE